MLEIKKTMRYNFPIINDYTFHIKVKSTINLITNWTIFYDLVNTKELINMQVLYQKKLHLTKHIK